jgi:hypothetical protein
MFYDIYWTDFFYKLSKVGNDDWEEVSLGVRDLNDLKQLCIFDLG